MNWICVTVYFAVTQYLCCNTVLYSILCVLCNDYTQVHISDLTCLLSCSTIITRHPYSFMVHEDVEYHGLGSMNTFGVILKIH